MRLRHAKNVIGNLPKLMSPGSEELEISCLDDHLFPPEDFETKGVLSSVCSRAVSKSLYITHLAPPELYWAVDSSARGVTRWTVACDRPLHRLMSSIHFSKDAVIMS